jgi:spore coat protein U-like protein
MPLKVLARAAALACGLGAHVGLVTAAAASFALAAAPTPAEASCSQSGAASVDFGTITIGNDGQRTVSTPITVRCTASINPALQRFACFKFPPGSAGDTANARSLKKGSVSGPAYSIGSTANGPAFGVGPNDYSSVSLGIIFGAQATLNTTFVLPAGQSGGLAAGVYTASQPVTVDVFLSLLTFSQCDEQRESSDTFNIPVQVTVGASCNLGTIQKIDFGASGDLKKTIDAQGAVAVTCTTSAPYTLSFGAGQNASGGVRQMKAGSNVVGYRLYRDAARTQEIAVNGTMSGTGTGSLQTVPVYGRVPAGAQPRVGNYGDFVVVTLSF